MAKSIDKGKRAEREVAALHNEFFKDAVVSRNLAQSRDGGYDLTGIPGVAIEVKHQEDFRLKLWFRQAEKQATGGRVPVLFYRKNRVPWRVRLAVLVKPVKDERIVVDVSLEDYFVWLAAHLKSKKVIK